MVHIEMSQDEARIVRKVLELHLSELRIDLAAAHIQEFEDTLKKEEALLESVLKHLETLDLSYPESMFGEYA